MERWLIGMNSDGVPAMNRWRAHKMAILRVIASKQIVRLKVPSHLSSVLINGYMKRLLLLSNLRPGRMQKLKVATNLGQNPGFEFLQKCWDDDPAKADCDRESGGEVWAVGDCLPRWGVSGLGGVVVKYCL
jgi:hypothetical protein